MGLFFYIFVYLYKFEEKLFIPNAFGFDIPPIDIGESFRRRNEIDNVDAPHFLVERVDIGWTVEEDGWFFGVDFFLEFAI